MFSRLRVDKIHYWIITRVLIVGILFVISPMQTNAEIQALKLTVGRLPQGWTLLNEYSVPQNKLRQFESRFAASIDEIVNQRFMVENQQEVQVNYLSGYSEFDTSTVYQALIMFVGTQNAIVRKGKVVIEIISDNSERKQEVIDSLALSDLQSRKLRSDTVPPNWRLVKEFFVYGDELKQFGQKFDIQSLEMINQFFLIDQERVQVNYVACNTLEDAESVYNKLYTLVGHQNLILKKDKIVLEIIAVNDEIKKIVEQLVETM